MCRKAHRMSLKHCLPSLKRLKIHRPLKMLSVPKEVIFVSVQCFTIRYFDLHIHISFFLVHVYK